jgi:hypothetical protein
LATAADCAEELVARQAAAVACRRRRQSTTAIASTSIIASGSASRLISTVVLVDVAGQEKLPPRPAPAVGQHSTEILREAG